MIEEYDVECEVEHTRGWWRDLRGELIITARLGATRTISRDAREELQALREFIDLVQSKGRGSV